MGIAVRAIIKKNGKFLLVQRSSNESNAGRWQFPGGKTEGLARGQSLKKEIKEETNLNIKNMKFFKKVPDVDGHTTIFYKAEVNGNIKLQDSELQNFGFFNKEEATDLNLTTSTAYILGIL